MKKEAAGYEMGQRDLLRAQIVSYVKKHSPGGVPEEELEELFYPAEVADEMMGSYIRRFMSDKIEIRPDGTCVLKEKG